jgi:hypothetical protein
MHTRLNHLTCGGQQLSEVEGMEAWSLEWWREWLDSEHGRLNVFNVQPHHDPSAIGSLAYLRLPNNKVVPISVLDTAPNPLFPNNPRAEPNEKRVVAAANLGDKSIAQHRRMGYNEIFNFGKCDMAAAASAGGGTHVVQLLTLALPQLISLPFRTTRWNSQHPEMRMPTRSVRPGGSGQLDLKLQQRRRRRPRRRGRRRSSSSSSAPQCPIPLQWNLLASATSVAVVTKSQQPAPMLPTAQSLWLQLGAVAVSAGAGAAVSGAAAAAAALSRPLPMPMVKRRRALQTGTSKNVGESFPEAAAGSSLWCIQMRPPMPTFGLRLPSNAGPRQLTSRRIRASLRLLSLAEALGTR